MEILFRRFRKKFIIQPNGCWQWVACISPYGYGQFRVGATMKQAHRVAYELYIGELPPFIHGGEELDHVSCSHRSCVNPFHTAIVHHRDNVLRGVGPTAENAKKIYCKRGHEFTEENTLNKSDGGRNCRICTRAIRAIATKKYRQTPQGKEYFRKACLKYSQAHREEKRLYAKQYRVKKKEHANG